MTSAVKIILSYLCMLARAKSTTVIVRTRWRQRLNTVCLHMTTCHHLWEGAVPQRMVNLREAMHTCGIE